MTDQNNALIVGIAQIIDYPSVYMGGPSRNSLRIAETIVKEFGADLARAVAAQPALGYDPACPECKGTGLRDSGGTHPWGEPAMMMCDCDAPPPAAPTDNTALVDVLASLAAAISLLERGGKKAAPSDKMFEQMLIDYRASLERGRTAALASREAPPASDSGEKPLCPVCYNRTDAELRAIGGFYSMESNCPECSPRAKERAKQDADREALVRLLQIITRNGSLDDGRTLHEVIADALLARGLRPPACQQEAVTVAEAGMDALEELANTPMDISLTDWQRISSAIYTALRALKGES